MPQDPNLLLDTVKAIEEATKIKREIEHYQLLIKAELSKPGAFDTVEVAEQQREKIIEYVNQMIDCMIRLNQIKNGIEVRFKAQGL